MVRDRVMGEIRSFGDEFYAIRHQKQGRVPLEVSAQLASAVLDKKNARRGAIVFGALTPLSVLGSLAAAVPVAGVVAADFLNVALQNDPNMSTIAKSFENVPTYGSAGLAIACALPTIALATLAAKNTLEWVRSNDNIFTKKKGRISVAADGVRAKDITNENTLLKQYNRQVRLTHYDWIGTGVSITAGVAIHFIPPLAPLAPVVAITGSAGWEIVTEMIHQGGNFFLFQESRNTLKKAREARNAELRARHLKPLSKKEFRNEIRQAVIQRRQQVNSRS